MPNAMTLDFTARALKCTLVLDPAVLVGVSVPDGVSRVTLKIDVPDRKLTASIAAKSLRRAIATIADAGPENVALILQGKLVGSAIEEAGLSAMPKPANRKKSRGMETSFR
jgi:hypothetical protein